VGETDNTMSDALTRKSLGWLPQRPGLLPDMRDSGCFA
jgi:hypothetical protein